MNWDKSKTAVSITKMEQNFLEGHLQEKRTTLKTREGVVSKSSKTKESVLPHALIPSL